jgi:hypothetical protein
MLTSPHQRGVANDRRLSTTKNHSSLGPRTEAQKAAFRWFQQLHYHLFRIVGFPPVPIPLWFVLRACYSDKHQPARHTYGYTYGKLFWSFKYKPIKLLEIGVGGDATDLGGESLNAWQLYFPFAQIIGCDLYDKRRLARGRIKIYQLDQSSEDQLEVLRNSEKAFDIVIDDASHISAHQVLTFERLYPALREGGIYVIEDVQTSYWKDWGGASIADAAFDKTCVGYFLNLTKYINHSEFTDLNGVDKRMRDLAKL